MTARIGLALLSLAMLGAGTGWGHAQSADIVGLGATTCRDFNRDIERNFQLQRDYFAWAQGYMSGILIRSPPGVDEGLQLNPPTFSLLKQVEFIRRYCAENPDRDYSEGVRELYLALRSDKRP